MTKKPWQTWRNCNEEQEYSQRARRSSISSCFDSAGRLFSRNSSPTPTRTRLPLRCPRQCPKKFEDAKAVAPQEHHRMSRRDRNRIAMQIVNRSSSLASPVLESPAPNFERWVLYRNTEPRASPPSCPSPRSTTVAGGRSVKILSKQKYRGLRRKERE